MSSSSSSSSSSATAAAFCSSPFVATQQQKFQQIGHSSFRPSIPLTINSRRVLTTDFQRFITTAVAAPPAPLQTSFKTATRDDVVTVAFVAHVDHGKSSLCDALLKGAKCFRENETVEERVMDGMDLEKERGITINASSASFMYNDVHVQILDTPGHADFGGEVERVLNMADFVVLLVDSVEGPKPQTRFVLKKAIELGKKIGLVVNKMDRVQARPEFVVDSTFDLMAELGASDEQMDFPIAYASAIKGESGFEPDQIEDNMNAVFELILSAPRPSVSIDAPLCMQVNNVDWDEFKGRLVSGRINSGSISKGDSILICHPNKNTTKGKVSELFIYDKLGRQSVTEAKAGDIIIIAGLSGFEIGDTIATQESIDSGIAPLPPISVDEPTVRMSFMVNTSEFAGQEGKYVTSRNIRDRLDRELERNVGLKLDEDRSSPESFDICGRGALHLTILIETMRREGYEMMIGPPTVITKVIDGVKHEPYEQFEVEVPEEYMGAVVDLLSKRKGEMTNMAGANTENMSSVTYKIPTRGLLGVKNALLTATKGTAVMNSEVIGYKPYAGDLAKRDNGSLVVHESGTASTYGLEGAQDRGRLIISPGQKVYKNQICGIHQRAGDLSVNICRVKALTNYRSANKEIKGGMQGLMEFSLDDCIEYVGHDEVVEVTPQSVRLSKKPKVVSNRR